MNELKKENKEKKVINKAIMISGAGVFTMLVSLFIKNSHIQDFFRGMGLGVLVVGAVVLVLVKVLREIYR